MAIRSYDFEDDDEAVAKPMDVEAVRRAMRSVHITPEVDERSRRATAAFNAMLPTMSSFAKMITGRPIKVVASPGTPCTDGKIIYLRPPIELGDRLAHLGGNKCDLRDAHTDRPLCAACCVREDVLITLYHEISHIAFESFDTVSEADKARLVERAVAESVAAIETRRAELFKVIAAARAKGDTEAEAAAIAESGYLFGKLSTREEKIAERLKGLPVNDYMTAAHVVSPYLPMMVNALEDVRVNHKMYQARPGTYRMFRGQAIRIFGEGIQNDDGTFRHWNEMPRNAQMIVALLAKAAGYNEYRDGWFRDDVTEALDDPELGRLLAQVATLTGPGDVYNLAFPVLERVRKLGFCKAKTDLEDDEPKPTGKGEPKERRDEDGESEPEDGDGEGEGEGGGVPEDDDEDGGTSSGGSSPSGSGEDGEETEDGEPVAEPEGEPEGSPEGEGEDGSPEDGEDGSGSSEPEDGEPTEPEGDEPEGKGGIGYEGEDDAEGKGSDSDDTQPSDDPDADADEAESAMRIFGGHGPIPMTPEKEMTEAAIDRAIVQAEDFDAPSRKVFGVNVHRWDRHIFHSDGTDRTASMGWNEYMRTNYMKDYYGMELEKISEGALGPSLIRMRAAFANNKLSAVRRDLKSGKIDKGVLGRRIATGDPRLFKRVEFPGKKDYEVVIGLDISGSTGSGAIKLLKQAALAQAELLHRCGVKFSIYAHSGSLHEGAYDRHSGLDVDIFVVKEPNEAWATPTRERLALLTPASANLDGHTLEWYRKRLDESSATDRIIMYYTDGAMPCENREEELTILQREIKTCARKGYTLMAVGIGTDAPIKHGLDTVQMDTMDELPVVVRHLEKRLSVRRAS